MKETRRLLLMPLNRRGGRIQFFGDYSQTCKELLLQCLNTSVNFVKREANIMAHAFARASRLYESHSNWVDPSNFVVGLSISTCICDPII